MAIKITSDRMIDLKNSELEELGISTISCYVNMAGKGYSDLDDIFPEDVFTHFERRGEIATTAAKSPELYYEFFKPFTDAGNAVIHFSASSGISSICANAKIAASRLPNVFVIDSLTLSNGIALLAKHAVDLVRQGESAERVYQACLEKRSKVQGSFIIETLDCLYKGGRCSGMQYFGANLLKIRPVIAMNDLGQMKIREKHRGNYLRAISKYIENIFNRCPRPDLKQLYLVHFCKDNVIPDHIVQEISKYHTFESIQFNNGGCNCAVHSGRNSVGIFFFSE